MCGASSDHSKTPPTPVAPWPRGNTLGEPVVDQILDELNATTNKLMDAEMAS